MSQFTPKINLKVLRYEAKNVKNKLHYFTSHICLRIVTISEEKTEKNIFDLGS